MNAPATIVVADRGALTVERACAMLAECRNVDEALEIRNMAKAMETYQRKQKAGREASVHAAEIAVRAERCIGELLQVTPKMVGGRPAKTGSEVKPVFEVVTPARLADLGVSKKESHQFQKLAEIPADTFEERVDAAKKEGKRPTVSNVLYESPVVPSPPESSERAVPLEPKPRETDPRRAVRAERDSKILPLVSAGHSQAEVAKMLDLPPTVVSDSVRRNAVANPVAKLNDYLDEAESTFRTWESAFRPEWATASSGQLNQLSARVDAMVAAARSFTRRLNKEAKRDR